MKDEKAALKELMGIVGAFIFSITDWLDKYEPVTESSTEGIADESGSVDIGSGPRGDDWAVHFDA
jgi:hypothetical protein